MQVRLLLVFFFLVFLINKSDNTYCSYPIIIILFLVFLIHISVNISVSIMNCFCCCSMTLTAALFITLGFNVWCGEMTRRFENCADATENDIDKAEGIDPKGFFMQMFTAQFGAWLSWATW